MNRGGEPTLALGNMLCRRRAGKVKNLISFCSSSTAASSVRSEDTCLSIRDDPYGLRATRRETSLLRSDDTSPHGRFPLHTGSHGNGCLSLVPFCPSLSLIYNATHPHSAIDMPIGIMIQPPSNVLIFHRIATTLKFTRDGYRTKSASHECPRFTFLCPARSARDLWRLNVMSSARPPTSWQKSRSCAIRQIDWTTRGR